MVWFNTYTSKLFENATFCSWASLFTKGHVETMEWLVLVSKSKVRSLSVSSNCHDKQHIIKPWLTKQNNFKYFAGYSQQHNGWCCLGVINMETPTCCWNLLLAHYSVQTTLSALMEGTSWHLPNYFLSPLLLLSWIHEMHKHLCYSKDCWNCLSV